MKRRNTVAIKTQVLFHRAGVWGTSTHPHNNELNNRCLSGWHHKKKKPAQRVFIHLVFPPLAIMHVYSRMNLAERRCFYICRSQFPLGRAPLFFKMLILAVYLSILKRSVCSSILTGLVPCARECCKEEPGKPLGPYFQFLPDDLKGRVSDTDFTLHFWSAPALIYW